jgi:hypothetical protein
MEQGGLPVAPITSKCMTLTFSFLKCFPCQDVSKLVMGEDAGKCREARSDRCDLIDRDCTQDLPFQSLYRQPASTL